jgi:subtilisin family serine protease
MKARLARSSALVLALALVAALSVPHISHASAAPAIAQPTASPHDADWTRPRIDPGAFKAAVAHAPMTSSSSRGFETTSPPNPCYYSVWFDPANDAPELDATSYGALYDCPSKTWTFPVNTRDTWASSELDFYLILLETDGNFNDGVNGADYALQAIFDQGTLKASLIRTPDNNQADWFVVADEPVSRSSNSQISMTVPNPSLGTPTNLRWLGAISGVNESGEDDIPDSTAHQEDGYTGPCLVGVDTGQAQSYAAVDDPQTAAAALRADGQPNVTASGSQKGTVHFSGDPARAGATLARAGIEANVSPDLVRHLQATPNDAEFANQWSLNKVKAPAAWDTTKGMNSVVVADLDSGVDGTHPDLAGKLVPGFDVVNNQPLSPSVNSDSVGHGTATAGVIGATTDNTVQLASLGWLTPVMPVKIAADANGAMSSNTATGITWATDHGAKVINLSIGSPCADANEHAAVNYAQAHNVLVVASGGNEALAGDRPDYPASYPGVLAVGATDNANAPASYSNFGNYIDIAAPGGAGGSSPAANTDILLLAPGGGLAVGAGTSFSAPLVSAAGALLFAVNPAIGGASARSLLMDTATDISAPGRDSRTGMGLLNAALAVQTAAQRSKFNPLTPTRILDTRNDAPLGPGATRQVKVTGASVPDTASAVIMNVTAVGPTAGSYLTVFPTGANQPLASNLNFPPGVIIPNLVVARVGSGGNVSLFNAQGSVNVLFDLVGWYGDTGDGYNAVTPTRILDTRDGTGGNGGSLGPDSTRSVKITGAGPVPASGVTAVAVNVTAVSPTAGSFLTVYPSGVARPTASNLNFPPGVIIPNLVVVKVGSDGNVNLYNAQGSVDVIFDVVGWYGPTGSSYAPLPPHRVLDTRDGTGTTATRLGPNEARAVKVAGVGGTPLSGVSAVALNVTAVSPSSGSFLTVYPSNVARPTASNLNFAPNQIIPNMVFVKVGSDGNVVLYNAQGTVDVVFDVVGWDT